MGVSFTPRRKKRHALHSRPAALDEDLTRHLLHQQLTGHAVRSIAAADITSYQDSLHPAGVMDPQSGGGAVIMGVDSISKGVVAKRASSGHSSPRERAMKGRSASSSSANVTPRGESSRYHHSPRGRQSPPQESWTPPSPLLSHQEHPTMPVSAPPAPEVGTTRQEHAAPPDGEGGGSARVGPRLAVLGTQQKLVHAEEEREREKSLRRQEAHKLAQLLKEVKEQKQTQQPLSPRRAEMENVVEGESKDTVESPREVHVVSPRFLSPTANREAGNSSPVLGKQSSEGQLSILMASGKTASSVLFSPRRRRDRSSAAKSTSPVRNSASMPTSPRHVATSKVWVFVGRGRWGGGWGDGWSRGGVVVRGGVPSALSRTWCVPCRCAWSDRRL